MKFRYYLIILLAGIAGLGAYTYSKVHQSFTLEALGFSITLPVSVWIMVVALAMALLYTLLLAVGGVRGAFVRYKDSRDFDRLIEQIISQELRNENSNGFFSNPRYALLGRVLARFNLHANMDSAPSGDGLIDGMYDTYKEIAKGTYVELRKYKLSEDNPYFIKNMHNMIEENHKASFEIIKGNYKSDLKLYALKSVIKQGTQNDIKKATLLFNKEIDEQRGGKETSKGGFFASFGQDRGRDKDAPKNKDHKTNSMDTDPLDTLKEKAAKREDAKTGEIDPNMDASYDLNLAASTAQLSGQGIGIGGLKEGTRAQNSLDTSSKDAKKGGYDPLAGIGEARDMTERNTPNNMISSMLGYSEPLGYDKESVELYFIAFINGKLPSFEDVFPIFAKICYSAHDYLSLAKISSGKLDPDTRIEVFERLKEAYESAKLAFIYTLLDLEMIDKARGYLSSDEPLPYELWSVQSYLILRDSNIRYPLNEYIK